MTNTLTLLPPKLMKQIHKRWQNGETAKDLAKEFGIGAFAMRKRLRQWEKGCVPGWHE